MDPGWVAPPAGIGILGPVGGAEVGSGDGGEPWVAIFGLNTLYLKALPTTISVVE